MKIQNSTHRNGAGRDRRHEAAMTLVELMISLGLFVVTIVGFLFVHISGLELNQVVRAKLGASDEARRALSRLVGDIRAAGVIRVGSGDIDEFVPITMGEPQIGNAIQVYPEKGNQSRFIRYYWDPQDGRLKRTEDGNGSEVVLAHSITNRLIFRGESHDGTVLTNNLNNRVIGLTMHFSQLVNPNIMIGQGGYFDYYQMHTRITRRALE
jgi:type II secretory pathway component PulJ